MNSSIQQFLRQHSRRFQKVLCKGPSLLNNRLATSMLSDTPLAMKPSTSITSWTKSSVLPMRSRFENHKEWLDKWRKPANTDRETLPEKKEDIKGVHSVTYNHLYRIKQPPVLYQDQFLSITFFPVEHHISLARKSNVALMFTLKGGIKLNDRSSEDSLRKYSGKYQGHSFLQQARLPLDSACRRSKYRKYVRKFMVDAINRLKHHKKIGNVAGVYYFRFKLFPTSGSDLRLLKLGVYSAFQRVLDDVVYNRKLLEHCLVVNGLKFQDMLRTCQKQKLSRSDLIPGVPKFPFTEDLRLLTLSGTQKNSSMKDKPSKKSKSKKRHSNHTRTL